MNNEVGYVISVGAGKNQLPLIKRLIERGYRVISFDRDIDAPGKAISHMFKDISTWDYEQAIQWLETLNVQFKGVLCFSYGRALVSQQRIIDYFSMDGKVIKNIVNIMIDKSLLRKFLKTYNLTTLLEYESYNNAILSYKYGKFVIKDKTGGSSRNIYVIDTNRDYNFFIKKMGSNSYILQEYLEGTEYRVVVLIKNQGIKFISILKRDNWEETFFTGRLEPQNYYNKDILNLTEQIIEKFKIEDSALKIDIIKDGNRIEILEIDFGIGGDYFETIIAPICYGYNFIDNYISLMLGLPVEKGRNLHNRFYFDYIYNPNDSENLVIKYDKIFDIASRHFENYRVIKIKNDKSIIKYPQNNTDVAFAIIHNNYNLNNSDVNRLFNKYLAVRGA